MDENMEQYIGKNQKKLRCGITTGTCVTAAAKAAASLLLLGILEEDVTIHTPKNISVTVPVFLIEQTKQRATFMVRKDSGDDPDVTNGAEIYANVQMVSEDFCLPDTVFSDKQYPGLYLDGGKGIGRVTKAGLEQKIGQAAINPVPRKMIFQTVREVAESADYQGGLLITASVPAGEELAKRTFNERLGIIGGISILGTSGIIEPMSEKAIVDTIETQIRQLSRQGKKSLLVTPGNYGQGYASEYLNLDLSQSIKCSNYIGDTIDLAISYGMEQFILVGNIGKLVKLAAGIMNTHSKTADARCEIFAVHTILCGGTKEMVQKIMECINTEEMLALLDTWKLREAVMDSICHKIQESMQHRIRGQLAFGVFIFSEKFGFLGRTEQAQLVLEDYKRRMERME
jgi:cobalt-precorrin-5B (C1)-methyltransferase